MTQWMIVVWFVCQLLAIVLVVLAVRWEFRSLDRRRFGAIRVSCAAMAAPLLTITLFVWIFVIGRSSNVAQLAGPDGRGLWRLWLAVWQLLFFMCPASLLTGVVAALCPPYPPKSYLSTAARLCAVLPAGFSWYVVIRYFPDA